MEGGIVGRAEANANSLSRFEVGARGGSEGLEVRARAGCGGDCLDYGSRRIDCRGGGGVSGSAIVAGTICFPLQWSTDQRRAGTVASQGGKGGFRASGDDVRGEQG